LTLKSQPSPHPPTLRLLQDPGPGCQRLTTTPAGGHAYVRTQPVAHHQPAAVSFGLHKPPPRCPAVVSSSSRIHQDPWRSYARRIQQTTRTNPSPDGRIHLCILPMAQHHLAVVGHSPHCPIHHQQSSAPAHPNHKKHHHPVTDGPSLVTTKPHSHGLRHARPTHHTVSGSGMRDHTPFPFSLGCCFSLEPLLLF